MLQIFDFIAIRKILLSLQFLCNTDYSLNTALCSDRKTMVANLAHGYEAQQDKQKRNSSPSRTKYGEESARGLFYGKTSNG